MKKIRSSPPLTVVPIGGRPVLKQVAIGIWYASFWRGVWYVLDDNLYPDDPGKLATVSLFVGSTGIVAGQSMIAKIANTDINKNNGILPRKYTPFARFGTLYFMSSSCVLVWRGTWMLGFLGYEQWVIAGRQKQNVATEAAAVAKSTDPGHLTKSGISSHIIATIGLLAFGRFASMLAPPRRELQFRMI